MEWFDADLELKITSGNKTEDPNIVPYINEGVMGLMITSSFLDTAYSCFIDGVELGNTMHIIYPKYLVLEESQGGSWTHCIFHVLFRNVNVCNVQHSYLRILFCTIVN